MRRDGLMPWIGADSVLNLSGSQPCSREITFDMQDPAGEVLVQDPVNCGTCVLEDVVMHYEGHVGVPFSRVYEHLQSYSVRRR